MAVKILVVDDDLESVKLIGLMLERRGYEIVAAQTGNQALEKVESEDPDLVILDIMMPDLDGYEISRRIRANPDTASLPIIMFTAKTQVDDKVTGFQAGADDYLTKPVHPDELVSRVEAVLARAARLGADEEHPVQAKVLGFLGSKGGVGTTTLAVNVATALAQGPVEGGKVILAEMQPGLAGAAIQLGLRHPGAIAELLDKPINRIERKMVDAQLEEHGTGLLLLSGQVAPPGVAMSVPPAHAHVIVRYLATMADYLLLDLGLGLGETNRRLLSDCDHTVVLVEPQRISLMLAQSLIAEMVESLNLARHRISVVMVNKAPSASTMNRETVEGLLQHDLAGVITPAPELAFQSAERGIPMVMIQPSSLVAQQIRTVADYLIGD